jgi:hypothetical protein
MRLLYSSFSFCVILIVGTFACQNADTKNEGSEKSNQTTKASSAEQLSQPGSIPVELMKSLWEECDYIDIIFYNSPVSVSQGDQAGIRNTLQFITTKPVPLNPDCAPMGRISFIVKGNIQTEADIYLSQGCSYFVFIEEGKIKYANEMTPQGINFISQVTKAQPPPNE